MTLNPTFRHIAGATAAGLSHQRNGVPNQDAHDFSRIQGPYPAIILAVADGAGSAPNSHTGSRAAVQAATRALRRTMSIGPSIADDGIKMLRSAIDEAHDAISVQAELDDLKISSYATTLLLAIVTTQWTAATQVGDGAIIVMNSETGDSRTLCQSHSGEYANETTFITGKAQPGQHLAHSGHALTSDYDSIGLTTDGLENLALKMPERAPEAGFWRPMFQWLRNDGEQSASYSLHHLLQSDRVRAKSSDDLTILIATAP